MGGNILTGLFFGSIFVLLLTTLFFSGLQVNYFAYYGIKEYFNQIFVDNQIWTLFLLFSAIFGYGLIFSKKRTIFVYLFFAFFILSLSSTHREVGRWYGEKLFLKSEVAIKHKNRDRVVDILYIGRSYLHYKHKNSLDVITLPLYEVEIIR